MINDVVVDSGLQSPICIQGIYTDIDMNSQDSIGAGLGICDGLLQSFRSFWASSGYRWESLGAHDWLCDRSILQYVQLTLYWIHQIVVST